MDRLGKHNYEAWLLDLAEGNLTVEQEQTLRLFLLTHPELDVDPDSLDLPHLTPEIVASANFESLKKEFSANEELVLNFLEDQFTGNEKPVIEFQINNNQELSQLLRDFSKTRLSAGSEVYEWKAGLFKSTQEAPAAALVYSYFEQQLSPLETAAVEQAFANNAAMRAELSAYRSTQLQADKTLVYPDKQALRRNNKVIALFSFTSLRYAAAVAVVFLLAFLLINNQQTKPAPVLAKQNLQKTSSAIPLEIQQPAIESNSGEKPLALAKNNAVNSSVNTKSALSAAAKASVVPVPANLPVQDVIIPVQKPEQNQNLANNKLPDVNNTEVVNSSLLAETGTYYANYSDLEISDDFSPLDVPSKKGALWHKAVDVARKINKLGFTAVNGTEESRTRHYRLSFNSISVEKK